MPVYNFVFGNCESGPCSISVEVHGKNVADALASLKGEFSNNIALDEHNRDDFPDTDSPLSYSISYVNPDHVTAEDVQDVSACRRRDCGYCGEYQSADNEVPEDPTTSTPATSDGEVAA